jgi:hypothetical protein
MMLTQSSHFAESAFKSQNSQVNFISLLPAVDADSFYMLAPLPAVSKYRSSFGIEYGMLSSSVSLALDLSIAVSHEKATSYSFVIASATSCAIKQSCTLSPSA